MLELWGKDIVSTDLMKKKKPKTIGLWGTFPTPRDDLVPPPEEGGEKYILMAKTRLGTRRRERTVNRMEKTHGSREKTTFRME